MCKLYAAHMLCSPLQRPHERASKRHSVAICRVICHVRHVCSSPGGCTTSTRGSARSGGGGRCSCRARAAVLKLAAAAAAAQHAGAAATVAVIPLLAAGRLPFHCRVAAVVLLREHPVLRLPAAPARLPLVTLLQPQRHHISPASARSSSWCCPSTPMAMAATAAAAAAARVAEAMALTAAMAARQPAAGPLMSAFVRQRCTLMATSGGATRQGRAMGMPAGRAAARLAQQSWTPPSGTRASPPTNR